MSYQRSITQRTQPNSKKPVNNIGIVIILAFILVTMLFILIYINTDRAKDIDPPHINNGSGTNTGLGDGNQPGNNPGSDDIPGWVDSSGGNNPGGGDRHDDDPDDVLETSPPDQPTRVAYLTFDDGPVRAITPGILDILLREDIKATFFVLPYENVDDLYQRIIDEGHEIGNHSYTHIYERLYERNVSVFREDIVRARNFILDNFNYTTTSFRFPGGSATAGNGLNARREVLNELGYRHFHWHVDPDDWRVGRSAEEVREAVRQQTSAHVANNREHVIILMHDRYTRTLEALPGIIEDLKSMGFTFDVVQNMP